MFFATESTSSVTHAAGSPATGVNAAPKVLVVLVKTKLATPAAVASSSRCRVPSDIGVEEIVIAVGRYMRLVQRRGMDDVADA